MAVFSRLLAATAFCGAFALSAAWAQSVDVKSDTAGQTALTEKGVKTNGSNPTAGVVTPVDEKGGQKVASKASRGGAVIHPKASRKAAANTPLSESGVAPRADLKNVQGPDAQAARSAESTARNTVYDPDDQIRSNSTAGTNPPAPGETADTSATADTGAAPGQSDGQGAMADAQATPDASAAAQNKEAGQ